MRRRPRESQATGGRDPGRVQPSPQTHPRRPRGGGGAQKGSKPSTPAPATAGGLEAPRDRRNDRPIPTGSTPHRPPATSLLGPPHAGDRPCPLRGSGWGTLSPTWRPPPRSRPPLPSPRIRLGAGARTGHPFSKWAGVPIRNAAGAHEGPDRSGRALQQTPVLNAPGSAAPGRGGPRGEPAFDARPTATAGGQQAPHGRRNDRPTRLRVQPSALQHSVLGTPSALTTVPALAEV
ncbi:hypothetical protein MAPG_12152 [Magnaporthiopsis poae ATCC 64411]|uniref:Uncharacterized protein n=1 Tax=Magnaporthiopsis poae (strain ATCC 64411 / 73-15) TaxID=644358 RepID=A0A0C4EGX4_MAGP6|nr:hypothetical protein MAPG_12152 [Magnaporthiopsis poae ATCC 64411]